MLLIGLGLLAYRNSFVGAFLFDDEGRIVRNPQIRQLWPPWDDMAYSSRPLVQLSLAVNYGFGGLNVWGYHALNLAVHLLAGLVLFGMVRRMLESEKLRARYGAAAPWLAMAVAGIWLVHPLQTESVTYIIQRAESFMGLFFLLTLYCGIRGARSPHSRAWYAAAVMTCAFGMGSKEVMVTAPIVMLLCDRVFLADSYTEIFRRRWGLYAGLAATWLLLGALLATSRQEAQTVLVTGLTPWRYAVTQFGVIVHYLWLSVWPHPLILDYTWPLADSVVSVLPWAAVVLALLAGTALALLRQAWVGFWGVWGFLILAPTSSVLPIADVAFEHRMYLPLAAVVVLIVIGGHEAIGGLLRRLGAPDHLRRWLEVGLVVTAVAALGYATGRRNEDYRSDLAMWSDTVAKRPENPRAHYDLGLALYQRRRLDEAIAHYAEALRLKPDYVDARTNLGQALVARGQITEGIAQYSEALRVKPDSVLAHNNLGVALVAQGQIQEGIAHYSEALRDNPDYADAHYNLGVALIAQGQMENAIVHLVEAVRLKPHDAEAQNYLGGILAMQGRVQDAIPHLKEAVRLGPARAEAHHNLGLALLKQGDLERAIHHFSQAIRLKPDYAEAHNGLGVALYRQGRITEAIAHYSEAVRLGPNFAAARNNLRIARASLEQPKDKR